MQDKTPLNIAIDDLSTEISRCKCNNEYEVGRSQALEAAKFILESLLPKEKEFVGKVFDEGFNFCCSFHNGDPYDEPKQKIINQLYPEK